MSTEKDGPRHAIRYADVRCIEVFLFIIFITVVRIIPYQVTYRESIAFSYIYTLWQMASLALLSGRRPTLLCCMVFATTIPTSQLYYCISSEYTTEMVVVYGCLYIAKEVLQYTVFRMRGPGTRWPRRAHDSSVGVAVLAFVATGVCINYVGDEYDPESESAVQLLNVLHYSTIFWVSHLNLLHNTGGVDDGEVVPGCTSFV
jgi:hypothetical protein